MTYSGGTDRAAKGPIELRRRLGEAREAGFAVDRDETFEGVDLRGGAGPDSRDVDRFRRDLRAIEPPHR